MVLIQGYTMGKSQKQLSFSLAYKPRRTDKNALGNTVNWLMKANENHFFSTLYGPPGYNLFPSNSRTFHIH